jgi:hypothetical protein
MSQASNDNEIVVPIMTMGVGGFKGPVPEGPAATAATGANVLKSEAQTAEALVERAGEIHKILDPVAQRMRTTAVARTSTGDLVGSGGRDLTPAQRAALKPGETATKLPKVHAERTVLNEAAKQGSKLEALGATRDFCEACRVAIEAAGGIVTSVRTAIWLK